MIQGIDAQEGNLYRLEESLNQEAKLISGREQSLSQMEKQLEKRDMQYRESTKHLNSEISHLAATEHLFEQELREIKTDQSAMKEILESKYGTSSGQAIKLDLNLEALKETEEKAAQAKNDKEEVERLKIEENSLKGKINTLEQASTSP